MSVNGHPHGHNPIGQITVNQDDVTKDVSVSMEFTTPDGIVGITLPLEEASMFCFALHEACAVGLQQQGELKDITGLHLTSSFDDDTLDYEGEP